MKQQRDMSDNKHYYPVIWGLDGSDYSKEKGLEPEDILKEVSTRLNGPWYECERKKERYQWG